jgi:DNA-binding NarL/FixJ family response regulator
MPRFRVLLADDHPAILARVSDLLSSEFDVVAAVGNGQAAVDAATLLQPDLVILDVSMPVLNGLDAAARIADGSSRPHIMFLTVHEDAEFLDAARSVGAQGYVVKRTLAGDLLPAIRLVLSGQSAYPLAHGIDP